MQAKKEMEWREQVTKEISNTLDPQVTSTRTLLKQKMNWFLYGPAGANYETSLLLPTSFVLTLKHETADRAAIDANTRRRISYYAKRFKAQTSAAIENIYLAASAQDWEEKKVSDFRERLEKDLKLHLQDFVGALKGKEAELKAAKSYKELLGAAEMLQNELATITGRLSTHLELVAKNPPEKRA